MADRPDGARLLELARRALLDEVLPAAGEAQRFDLLMIASAMAIAARELQARPEDGAQAPAADLAALAREIRAGRRDACAETYRRLREDVTSRLKLSNPKALPDGV